jgi:hypothetical protein
MGRMIEACAERLQDIVVPPEAIDLEISRAVGALFRGFNSRLSEEQYSRKHRFRTDALVKEAETEVSTLREDGALVAVFERDNGSIYWLPGFIEEVRMAKSDFSDERITSDQLQRVDKQYVKEVAINDSRGIYLLRWYVEVSIDGKDLIGYGNRGCVGYRLPSDNNKEPFVWMSNYQVLAPVEMRMREHATCKMFVIQATDLKVVKQRFADLTAPPQEPLAVAAGGAGGSGAAQLPAQIAIKPLPNPHAAAVAAEAEKDQAKELAATLRKAARSESLGRREAARAAQLADDTKRRKKV